MRNRYPGTCYRCGNHVAAGDGHFERYRGGWRTQHADCAIRARRASDSDGSPQGGDAKQGSVEDDSAGRDGIAQNPSRGES